jgi:prevent-host-death family protein
MSKPVQNVPTTELSRNFSDYLARVRFGGETLIVMKNGAPVAELRGLPSDECSLGRFLELWKRDSSDKAFADDIEMVNQMDTPPENPWD